MCGIFGIVAQKAAPLNSAAVRSVLRRLYELSESRGKEASGLALAVGDTLAMLKRDERGKSFIRLPEAEAMLQQASPPFALMGHTRMVTNGDSSNPDNNQPVTRGRLACIHNGIITNDAEIWAQGSGLQRRSEVDTEAFLALAEDALERSGDMATAVRQVMPQLVGANSFAVMDRKSDSVLLTTTNGSLYWVASVKQGLAVFASERFILERIIKEEAFAGQFTAASIRQITPGQAVLLTVSGELVQQAQPEQDWPKASEAPERRLADCGSNARPAVTLLPRSNISRLAELQSLTRIDKDRISALRRCSRCLIPENFPFIHFDEDGVCSLCRAHKPQPMPGADVLAAVLKGQKTCLAPLSGGRDSCYGIHFMVKEMGLKPVAYTYDWGMVTDLARRNISRMCGALGIEHILISADIGQKRDFIRKNVSAWLKRPQLGTVPLFMAGDKQFFYYAEKLRRQMRLDTILFSMNPLERTDFKVGFCGIDEGYDKDKHYNPSWINKLRIAAYYGREYLLNPAYMNTSLIDTLGAFASYYILPKGYHTLFDYIPWQEKEIEQTIIGQYGWETASDTRSTWRIGDGTAAFYNYIYLRVAGFTEFDTFRSNQIREGLIDRETALAEIEHENQPRLDSLAWYCDAIGVDAVAAVKRINQMPTLY